MAEVGSAFVSILASARGFGSSLQRQVGPQVDGVGRRTGSRFSSAFKGALGLTGIGAALGVANLVKDSIQLEAEFSKTMRQIGIATGVPEARLERLDALAIKLGKDTVFSASDASKAMLELAKNGIPAATIEAGALDSALTLAAAGGVDMTTAATTMGNALNAFNLKGKESKSVAAALAGAANSSSASIGSIAEGLQQASAVAADSGFTLQETTGALAAFANAGIAGSDAGTSLKTAIARLLPTTTKAKGVMRQYGLLTYDAAEAQKMLNKDGLKAASSSYAAVYKAVSKYLVRQGVAEEGTVKLAEATEKYLEVSGALRNDFIKKNGDFKDLADISGELNKAFGDLSESERAAALNTLFGSDARRAASILVKEGEKGLRGYIKATEDQTQADKLAKANMEGTAGAIERLKGAWETAKLEFGKSIAPVAADFMEFLADKADEAGPKLTEIGGFVRDDVVPPLKTAAGFAESMVKAFQSMPSWAKKALITGAVGGLAAKKILPGVVGGAIKLGYSRAVPLPVFVVNNAGGAGGPLGGSKGLALTAAKVTILGAFAVYGTYITVQAAKRSLEGAQSDGSLIKSGVRPGMGADDTWNVNDSTRAYLRLNNAVDLSAAKLRVLRDAQVKFNSTVDKTPREVEILFKSKGYAERMAEVERIREAISAGFTATSDLTPRGFGSDATTSAGSPVFGPGTTVNFRVNDIEDTKRTQRELQRKRARAGH